MDGFKIDCKKNTTCRFAIYWHEPGSSNASDPTSAYITRSTSGNLYMTSSGGGGMTTPNEEEIEEVDNDIPQSFVLHQAYPNPFNPTTTISFDLPEDAVVTLKVLDVLGREVATLANGEQYKAGNHEIEFNADFLISGMYFYRITAQGVDGKSFSDVKKMLFMK
ncbi:MAG: T9SS type A sorting domain-containing protein [Ignavibacteriae bacterium]|nr:T9SS type A sorting domain-containing protein [Ignavibacteriota bacterium]